MVFMFIFSFSFVLSYFSTDTGISKCQSDFCARLAKTVESLGLQAFRRSGSSDGGHALVLASKFTISSERPSDSE